MGWAGQGFSGEILRWQYLSPSYSGLLLTPRPSRLNTLDGAHTSTPSLCLYDHTRILRYVHNNPLLLQRGARPNSKLHTSLLLGCRSMMYIEDVSSVSARPSYQLQLLTKCSIFSSSLMSYHKKNKQRNERNGTRTKAAN